MWCLIVILCCCFSEAIESGSKMKMEILNVEDWDPSLKERWANFLEQRGREIGFDSDSSTRNITAVSGQDVYLTCALNKPLSGKYKISFVRLRDLNLLAVGRNRHTKDERMEILHSKEDNSKAWTLRIRDVTLSDAGLYECILNSIPHSKSLILRMSVLEGYLQVYPENEVLHLDVGSNLNLTCIVKTGPVLPKYIHWYYKNRILKYAENSNAQIDTQFSLRNERNDTFHRSSLFIKSVTSQNSGEYKCGSDLTSEKTLKVYVVREDLKTLHLGTVAVDEDSTKEVSSSLKTRPHFLFHSPFLILYVFHHYNHNYCLC